MAGGRKSGWVEGSAGQNPNSPEYAAVRAIIQLERNDQLKLCDGMELIADQLPDEVDFKLYESIYEKLRRNLPIYHRNEEALFERATWHELPLIEISSVLDCIRHEHATHNCYADELYEYLDVLRTGIGIKYPSTIGYMLRSCFYSVRRHIAWEDLMLMPVVKHILTADDVNELIDEISKNRRAIGLDVV